jgi:hypothetical protein
VIKPEQIPEEVLRALCASMGCEWVMQDKEDQIIIRRHIAAAIAAWPGWFNGNTWPDLAPTIVLPLSHEDNDDHA